MVLALVTYEHSFLKARHSLRNGLPAGQRYSSASSLQWQSLLEKLSFLRSVLSHAGTRGSPMAVVPEFRPAENPTFSTELAVLSRSWPRSAQSIPMQSVISTNAYDWSGRMQTSGQGECNFAGARYRPEN